MPQHLLVCEQGRRTAACRSRDPRHPGVNGDTTSPFLGLGARQHVRVDVLRPRDPAIPVVRFQSQGSGVFLRSLAGTRAAKEPRHPSRLGG